MLISKILIYYIRLYLRNLIALALFNVYGLCFVFTLVLLYGILVISLSFSDLSINDLINISDLPTKFFEPYSKVVLPNSTFNRRAGIRTEIYLFLYQQDLMCTPSIGDFIKDSVNRPFAEGKLFLDDKKYSWHYNTDNTIEYLKDNKVVISEYMLRPTDMRDINIALSFAGYPEYPDLVQSKQDFIWAHFTNLVVSKYSPGVSYDSSAFWAATGDMFKSSSFFIEIFRLFFNYNSILKTLIYVDIRLACEDCVAMCLNIGTMSVDYESADYIGPRYVELDPNVVRVVEVPRFTKYFINSYMQGTDRNTHAKKYLLSLTANIYYIDKNTGNIVDSQYIDTGDKYLDWPGDFNSYLDYAKPRTSYNSYQKNFFYHHPIKTIMDGLMETTRFRAERTSLWYQILRVEDFVNKVVGLPEKGSEFSNYLLEEKFLTKWDFFIWDVYTDFITDEFKDTMEAPVLKTS